MIFKWLNQHRDPCSAMTPHESTRLRSPRLEMKRPLVHLLDLMVIWRLGNMRREEELRRNYKSGSGSPRFRHSIHMMGVAIDARRSAECGAIETGNIKP